ncbi:MAG: cytidylate kinase family protein [Candidatus Micrarchaeia archaeon]
MKIAIGGLSGCGKTTIGQKLSEELGIEHISFSFKDLAKQKGISLMKFQELARKNPDIDLDFDKMLYGRIKNKNDFVITTWLGPWFDKLFDIKFDFKIWINLDEKTRAERLSKRDGFLIDDAKKHLKERDLQNQKRYIKLYNIDIFDKSSFDFEIENRDIADSIRQILNNIKRN